MKKICLATIACLITTINYAQPLNFEWAQSIGSSSNDLANSTTIDASGNVITTGYFSGTADFDPGASTYTLTSNGSSDIFVYKSDAAGNFNWAISFGGTTSDEAFAITTDAMSNVYVTGWFQGSVDFDPGASTFMLNSNGDRDIFIQKLDSAGNFLWAKAIGAVDRDDAFDITIDNANNVLITGRFEGIVDFDPGASTFNVTSNGNRDIFILKLSAAGNFMWVKSMGDVQVDRGSGIKTDGLGNIYLTGSFAGTTDFDPGSGIFNLTSNGGDDLFVEKLDGNGNYVWAVSMGGPVNDDARSIALDGLGNVFTTGSFAGNVDFDPGASTFMLNSSDSVDVFVQKLDAAGNFIWAKSTGGSQYDSGHSIGTDAANNVYITGSFSGTVDFDPSGGIMNLTSSGLNDVFIQKLDAAGNFLWAGSIGGTTYDQGNALTIDNANNIYISGYFEGTVDFDPGSATSNLISNGSNDIFLLKLGQMTIGFNENNLTPITTVYPNPSNEEFNIDFGKTGEVSIKLFSINGQLIYVKENILTSTFQFSFNTSPGVYFLEVLSENELQKFKLIKY